MPDRLLEIDRLDADYQTPFEILAGNEDWSISDLLDRLPVDEEYILRRVYGIDRNKPASFEVIAREYHRPEEWVRQKCQIALLHARQIIRTCGIKVNPKK